MKKLIAAVICLAAAWPSVAQQDGSKTLVSMYKVKWGKMGDFVTAVKVAMNPALDQLLADRVIESYGMTEDVLHSPGAPNVAVWFSARNYANIEKAEDALRAAAQSHPAEAQVVLTATDMEAHEDLLLETVTAKTGKIPPQALPLLSISYDRVKPGRGADWSKMGDKYFKPIYDKMADSGAIYGYALMQQAWHSGNPGGRWILVWVADMAAFDKMDGVFADAMQKLTPDEKAEMRRAEDETSDESAHRDYLQRSILFKAAQQ